MGSLKRVYSYVKQDRFVMEDAEVETPWTGSTDVSALTTSVSHREGTKSLSFAKSGTTQSFAQITRTIDADSHINLVDFLRGKLRYWINLSSLTDIVSVQLIIGESASHNYIYTTLDTALTTGWNEISVDIDTPSATTGDGAAWSSIGYIAIKVNFDANGNTLSAILVDAISAVYELNTRIESMNLTGIGLATSAKQDTGNTSLSSIDTKLSSQATATKQDLQITQETAMNTVLGTTSDEAVDSDAAGTVSAKLRGLVKIFADVWDAAANLLRTEEQMAPVAEDNDGGVIKVEERYTTVVIEANATTTHVTGAGFLKGFVVTDVGASANVLDIYDNTAGSGTKIVSQVDTVACQTGYYPVNRAFTTGLTTVLATGTAAKLYLIYEDRSA